MYMSVGISSVWGAVPQIACLITQFAPGEQTVTVMETRCPYQDALSGGDNRAFLISLVEPS